MKKQRRNLLNIPQKAFGKLQKNSQTGENCDKNQIVKFTNE